MLRFHLDFLRLCSILRLPQLLLERDNAGHLRKRTLWQHQCLPGTRDSIPERRPIADTAATSASHELSEAITDPEGSAWYTASGYEIGDLCAYNYGVNTWDSAKANQMWNGRFYELQQEYDNHTGSCVQVGP